MSTITKRSLGAALCVFAALVGGCAGQTALEKQQEAELAQYRTTCLKRGLAVDTPEHTECVISLHQQEQQRVARLNEAIPPPKPTVATPPPYIGDMAIQPSGDTGAPQRQRAPSIAPRTDVHPYDPSAPR